MANKKLPRTEFHQTNGANSGQLADKRQHTQLAENKLGERQDILRRGYVGKRQHHQIQTTAEAIKLDFPFNESISRLLIRD
jgi:hypothetical protein